MTRMKSRPVTITQVYPQDNEPTDKRDGVLWVDTSVSPPDTYVWDAAGSSWEPVAPGNVTISDTAPTGVNEGHLWIDTSTSPPTAKVLDAGGAWNPIEPEGWQEDGNSPVSLSGVASHTYNLAQNYDVVKIVFEGDDTAVTTAEAVVLQVNGDTGTNYNFNKYDGTQVTSNSQFVVGDMADTIPFGFEALIDGRWTTSLGAEFRALTARVVATNGDNRTVASPLNSFTLASNGGSAFSGTLGVYGKSL